MKIGGPVRRATSELKDVTYWAPIANSGRAYIWAYRSQGKKPYVVAGVSLYNAGASEVWHQLKANEPEFGTAFGESLEWHANKIGTAFHIQTARRPAGGDEDWAAQQAWLAERMVRFESLFADEIKQLIDAFDAGELPSD